MIRSLLFWLSGYLPCRLINDGAVPYLERYHIGQAFGWTFHLHRFVDSDPGRGLHDHPFRAFSIVLAGHYIEQTRAGSRVVRWFNSLSSDTFHRIVIPDGMQVWTLFAHGPKVKSWGFIRPMQVAHNEEVMLWVGAPNSNSGAWWKTAPKGKDTERQAK